MGVGLEYRGAYLVPHPLVLAELFLCEVRVRVRVRARVRVRVGVGVRAGVSVQVGAPTLTRPHLAAAPSGFTTG